MKSVYGNSYLNIAANAATGCEDGIFSASTLPQSFPAYTIPPHPNLRIRQHPFFQHTDYGSNYGISKNAPVLLRRGWVLQERLLSPRVVYYDTEELKWGCNATMDCQCGGIVSVYGFKLDHFASVTRGESPLPYAWMRIAEKYSEMQLTFDEDRSVALIGLVDQAMKFGGGGRYLAGLWEKHFAHQICWEVLNIHRKPGTYIAPSWSWLSVFGTIWYTNGMDYWQDSSIDVEVSEVECTYEDGKYNTGRVMDGSIRLNGRIAHMEAELCDAGSINQPPTYQLKHHGTGFELGEVEMDFVVEEEIAKNILKLSVLYWGDMDADQSTFLVLKPVPGREGVFQRHGIFDFG